MATPVVMPQLGESVVEGTVGTWLVAEGQPVKQYDPLLAVTTDKVDTEITAPASGILLKIYIPEGQTVEKGTLLALIGQPGEAIPDAPPAGAAPHGAEPVEAEFPVESPQSAEPVAPMVVPTATPVAQRMALEHGVDLTEVKGTGPAGRITKEDVAGHLPPDAGSGPEQPAPATDGAAGSQAGAPAGAPAGGSTAFISPVVARLAAEHHIDLTQVRGTGEGGRVTKKDVQAYVAQGAQAQGAPAVPQAVAAEELPPWEQPGSGSLFKPTEEMGLPAGAAPGAAAPATAPAAAPRPAAVPQPAQVPAPARPAAAAAPMAAGDDSEIRPLSNVRRSIAKHMVLSKHTSAHVTTVMEADMTPVARARERLLPEFERQGTRLTFTPFFLQAIIAGLRAVPEANSSLQDDNLLVHRRIHLGMAVAVAEGLIVPVIRDADEKSLLGLARAVNDLAERARTRRLQPDEVQGGTFTLTNHGTAGSLFATPIINQPQAGILGVGAIQKRPVVISHGKGILPGADDTIAIRPMVYLSFTFDHRILDGAGGDGFLAAVKHFLESYAV